MFLPLRCRPILDERGTAGDVDNPHQELVAVGVVQSQILAECEVDGVLRAVV